MLKLPSVIDMMAVNVGCPLRSRVLTLGTFPFHIAYHYHYMESGNYFAVKPCTVLDTEQCTYICNSFNEVGSTG